MFDSPRALAVTAGVIGLLGVIPGMPHLVFLLIAAGLASAWRLDATAQRSAPKSAPAPAEVVPEANAEASWDDLQPVDTLGLEVGYRLIALVDKARQGDLLARIKGVRAQVRAGRRLPAAAGAHPRQPRAQAERLPPDAARRDRRRRRGLPGHAAGDQPGRRDAAAHRHRAPPTRPSACPRSGSRSASASRPK